MFVIFVIDVLNVLKTCCESERVTVNTMLNFCFSGLELVFFWDKHGCARVHKKATLVTLPVSVELLKIKKILTVSYQIIRV